MYSFSIAAYNHHTFNGLKQQLFIISQGSHKAGNKLLVIRLLSGDSGEKLASNLIQVICRI